MKTFKESNKNILSTQNAYINCINDPNQDENRKNWTIVHYNRIIEILEDVLPSGSGIDCKWDIEILENSILCKNSYHKVNENGMYNGYINFAVKIFCDRRDVFGEIIYSIKGNFGKHQDIKDYLFETLNYCFENL